MLKRACTALAVITALPVAITAAEIDSNTFGGLEARAIGPATMSGRIAALDVVGEDPLTLYVGSASGGLWKSVDGGITYEPIFDDHTQSIGAVKIDPNDPEVVWVGTGEGWTRNSTSVGDGVYKSTDGGKNWKHLGLTDSERITRIAIDPADSDTVFVCATGHLWDANEERGVYRTRDGGESWEAVLQVDEDTGCSDLSIDPQNGDILYAGMWQFRRSASFFRSGGPGSGLYRSTDGGDSWEELTNGLPEGEKGRIAVAVAPSRPSVVYAVVEAEKTGLYRSDDLGNSWKLTSTEFNIQARPFYFAYVVVDPTDYRRVYKPGFSLTNSSDGGESFTSMFTSGLGGSVHSDHHALWINPANPHELVLGTDGGVYISHDRGNHWRFVGDLPLAQYYHVSYDLDYPYNVYGGLQDNGTWMGPSQKPGGILNSDWELIGTGDGFYAIVDPIDPDYVYVESQGGNVMRYRRSTKEAKDVKPYADEEAEELRFNWDTPIHASSSDEGTIYVGSQYLLRSRDRGESWERISPDLTTDDPERQRQSESGGLSIDNSTAENNTTIFTISESPLDPRIVWVGSDDGLVHVTRDGGESWTDVTAAIPDLPAGLWVSEVEAGHHAEGTAYVTVDGHYSGDMTTYVYRTSDFGQSWQSLATDELEGFAHVVREDPIDPELLFLGTEHGLFVSIDGGAQWAR
ncbi:MAG: glycosyl hydrolase, partial [Thermoanaerobaculia bacterium]|nr:glycosyl hydrolase [Thermoanaerobaculia bacterium]